MNVESVTEGVPMSLGFVSDDDVSFNLVVS